MPNINVSVKDKVDQLNKSLKAMQGWDVLVGIPQEKSTRKPDKITNAELMFVHTNGSPLRHIPARPVIEPAIEDDKEVISEIMGNALKSALNGDMDKAIQLLNTAGLEGQGAAQDWFTNPKNGWPENSPKVKKAKLKKGSTDPKPLIDTGELRKSITYIVRKEG